MFRMIDCNISGFGETPENRSRTQLGNRSGGPSLSGSTRGKRLPEAIAAFVLARRRRGYFKLVVIIEVITSRRASARSAEFR